MGRSRALHRVRFPVTREELQAELARRQREPWDGETYEIALEALTRVLDQEPLLTAERKVAMIRGFGATFASVALALARWKARG